MADLQQFLTRLSASETLNADEATELFELMMSGAANDAQIAGILMAMRVRGETVPEITGAARIMRAKATPINAPADAIDIVGTGGDAKGTHNISTCATLITAGAGVPVAKHGNRSVSSKSGSADVLEALGVNLAAAAEKVEQAIREANVGFMFAPAHHSAMKHVMPARKALGVRTIFNLLGPLTNPAGAKRQLLGVFAREWVRPIADALQNLGIEKAWVAHGADGMDELTTTGETHVAIVDQNGVQETTISPEDAGLARCKPEDLIGGDAAFNAAAIRELLGGAPSAFRDVALLNAGGALVVAGKADNLRDGVTLAAASVDEGAALRSLEKMIEITNS